MSSKICIKCKVEKPTQDFRKHSNGNNKCRDCINAYERQIRLNNYEHCKNLSRIRHLKNEYGITLEEFNKMNEEQNGLCAICKKPENPSLCDSLSVDHNHTTGKIRALLCRKCNSLLGLANDNALHLRLAADYLERWTPSLV